MKEIYIKAHEELIMEYLESHPEATDKEAEEATAQLAWDRMKDIYADMIDSAKDRLDDERMKNDRDSSTTQS